MTLRWYRHPYWFRRNGSQLLDARGRRYLIERSQLDPSRWDASVRELSGGSWRPIGQVLASSTRAKLCCERHAALAASEAVAA